MADISESNTWEPVYKLATSDPVLGGAETAKSNLPHKNLTNRTKYLKTLVDNIVSGVQGIVGKLLDGSTCDNHYTGDQQNNTAVASTGFTQGAISARAGRRNLLLNGNMRVSQRGTSFNIGANGKQYTLDRWLVKVSAGSGAAATISQIRSGIAGIHNAMHIAMPAGSDTVTLIQRIEGVSTLEKMNAIFQILIKANRSLAAEVIVSQYLNQNQLDNGTPLWNGRVNLSITSGTSVYTAPFTIPEIVFPTEPDTSACLQVEVIFTHPGGAVAVAMDISNVQIENGSIPSAFEERDDFNECLRYFEKTDNFEQRYFPSSGDAGSQKACVAQFYHHKRMDPRITYGNVAIYGILALTDPDHISHNRCSINMERDSAHPPTGGVATTTFQLLIDAEIN